MRTGVDRERPDEPEGEVEFFGFKLTVRSPRLAALLNSCDEDDVRVVGEGDVEAVALGAAEPSVLRVSSHPGPRVGDAPIVRLRPARDDV